MLKTICANHSKRRITDTEHSNKHQNSPKEHNKSKKKKKNTKVKYETQFI